MSSSNRLRCTGLIGLALMLSACQGAQSDAGAPSTATTSFIGPMQCTIALPDGPPQRPEPLSAFGTAAALNVGRSMGRNVITGAGTVVAGPVGGAVAGNVAARALPSEFDIRGAWSATDGTPNCGCSLAFQPNSGWTGTNPGRGTMTQTGCRNSLLATVNDWRLDEAMAGLEGELLIYAGNGNRIAVLTRNGPDHYSGTLSDGGAVTIWR